MIAVCSVRAFNPWVRGSIGCPLHPLSGSVLSRYPDCTRGGHVVSSSSLGNPPLAPKGPGGVAVPVTGALSLAAHRARDLRIVGAGGHDQTRHHATTLIEVVDGVEEWLEHGRIRARQGGEKLGREQVIDSALL